MRVLFIIIFIWTAGTSFCTQPAWRYIIKESLTPDKFMIPQEESDYRDLIQQQEVKSSQSLQNSFFLKQEIYCSLVDSINPTRKNLKKEEFTYIDVEFQHDKPYRVKKKRTARSAYINQGKGYKVLYNNKIWQEIDPATLNTSADVAFKMINEEVYGVIVAENDELNLKELRYTVVYNLYRASEKHEIVRTALRKVNGHELLTMQFKALINSLDIDYYSYYYTGKNRVIQFSTFAGSDSFKREKDEMQYLLNGLIILKIK